MHLFTRNAVAFILLATFSSVVSAQIIQKDQANKIVNGSKLIRFDEKGKHIKYIELKEDIYFSNIQESEWLKKALQFSNKYSLKSVRQSTDKSGYTHTKYQIYYKNIPVEGAQFIVHSISGRVHSANGDYSICKDISTTAALTEKDAYQRAVNHVNAKKYKWEENIYSDRPIGELTILTVDSTFKLTYKFDIYSTEPLSRQYIYVDAQTGDIIQTINRIHFTNTTGTAKTMYNGSNVPITTDYYNGSYRLQETGRGGGIETYNLNHSTSYSTATDFTDNDNRWTDTIDYNHAANDAHFATEATYDYFYNNFGRNSYDDRGSKLVSYVHYSRGYVNAFWDGSCMTYGDGDGVTYLPLTPIEVVAHEITHGVTEHSAGLIYANESGALNESFSDIFGIVIDFIKNPTTANYLMGDAMSVRHEAFRSMQNPNDYQCPDTYKGLYWDSFEEVHTNSGVQNYWFYLLSEGGSGTNDLGNIFEVTGIGREKAAKIAYRNLTEYLTPSSNYADARFYSIQAAIDLFGDCSPEVIAVTNAWHAVGVGDKYNNKVIADFLFSQSEACKIPATINFYNRSFKASSYRWDFGDRVTDTAKNPVHTFITPGSFTIKLIASGNTICNNTDTLEKTIHVTVGNSPAQATCNPRTISPGDGGIYAFSFNTINNISQGSGEDYQDFTCSKSTHVTEGRKYPVYIKIGQSSLENVCIWVDLNNDGDFIDPGEKVAEKRNVSKSFTDSIIFPKASVYNVPLRLRVGTDKITSPLPTPCLNSTYGQFHDYSVVVQQNLSVPETDFFSARTKIISGDTIQFKDKSLNLPISWSWSFPGGAPSTSTLQNPRISYSTPGIYNVTLTSTNRNGSKSLTKTGYIEVTTPAPTGLSAVIEDDNIGKVKLKWFTANDRNVFEDFEDNEADNFIYSDNVFSVENGYLKVAGNGDNTWKSACYDRVFQDFILEYKFQRTIESYYSIGTFIRADGFFNSTTANGYLINVLPSGSYSAWKTVNGSSTNMIAWSSSSAINTSPGAWNVVTIEAVGNKIRIFINSQFVDEFTDNTFSSGKINLGSYFGSNYNHDNRWDYVNIITDATLNNDNSVHAQNSILSGNGDITQAPAPGFGNSFVEAKGLIKANEVTSSGSNVFRYYKIYRDSVLINTTTNTNYIDTLPKFGKYKYFIKSFYDEGESDPSNTISVIWEELNPGDKCTNAQDLSALTSPYNSSTLGYAADFTVCNMGNSPDRVFYIDLPAGSSLSIGQIYNNFDSKHSIRIGGQCPGVTELQCVDDPDEQMFTYSNTTNASIRLYYILSGYGSAFGNFTLKWNLQVPAKPTPLFSSSTNLVTSGSSVQFSDESKGIPTSWKWYFPGGSPSYSTSKNPYVSYNSEGLYDVKLVVSNSLGTDSVTKSRYIMVSNLDYCKSDLGGDNTCPGDITAVSITGTSLNNTSHNNCSVYNRSTYAFFPPYENTTATLKADSIYEFSVTTHRSDIISVWIDYNQNSIFEESEWTQVTTSSTPNAATKVLVKIPVSARSGLTGMRIRTRSAGSSNGAGDACSTFASGITEDYFINLYQVPKKPIANFSAKQNIVVGEEVKFTDLTGGVPTSWKWYFNGAKQVASTLQNPVAMYSVAGNYDVKLVASNSLGTDSIIKQNYITVNDALEGEGCINAQNLENLVSPYSSSTVGYDSNFDFCSFGNSPDRIFFIDVPSGSTLQIGQTYNNFDSRHSIRTGGVCPGTNTLTCVDDPDDQKYTYTNTSLSTQRIYYVLGGFGSGYGEFTLEWNLQTPAIPKADFTANNTEIERNSYVAFTDQSTGLPISRTWYFEGGSPAISNSSNPSVYYQTPGKYNVTLVVFNSLGKDSIVKTDYIYVASPPKPVANFLSGGTVIKEGNSVYFYDNSSNYPESFKWYFAGGTPATSTSRNLDVKYDSPGIYDVKLVVSNAGGSDSIVKTGYVTVVKVVKPMANFYAQSTNIMKGSSIYFNNNSAYAPTNFKWVFEGGTPTTSIENSPYITYNTPGIYDVKLIATNSAGSDSMLKSDYITVTLPTKPVAEFTSNTDIITPGKTISFIPTSNNNDFSYKWTFSGGNPSTSTNSNPYVTYNTPGTFDVKLVVYNDGGSDSITKTGYITVVNTLPGDNCTNAQNLSTLSSPYSASTVGYNSDFSFCSFGSYPDRIFYIDVPNGYVLNIGQTFNDFDSRHAVRIGGSCPGTTELICKDDPDTEPYTYTNSSGSTQRIYYIIGGYSGAGKFTLEWSLRANNSLPVAKFSADNTTLYGSGYVYFSDQSIGAPSSWKWYFPGATPSMATSREAEAFYSTPGKYKVTLVVTNSYGKDSLVKNDYINVVQKPKPVANFGSYVTSTNVGGSIVFYDESTNEPTSRKWDFEGGTPSSSNSYNQEVTYNNAGTYTVKLVVSNASGKDSIIRYKYITVTNLLKPVANFNVNNAKPIVGNWVYFSDNSGNNPTSWKWTFTGANPSNSTYSNPSVTYSTPGLYSVKLVVSNAAGSDSITKTGYINVTLPPKPVVNFTTDERTILVGESVGFYNFTTNDPTSYKWTFQGGTPTTSSHWSPTIQYNTPGNYDVKLVAFNLGGADSLVKAAYIRVVLPAKPRAAFNSSTANVVAGSQISFYDNSTNNPTARKWIFQGGFPEQSSSYSPSVQYNTPGTYSVKLVVSNAGGADSVTRINYVTVTMPNKPVANFYADPQFIVPGYYVDFYSSSSNNPTAFRWEFQGGNPSLSTNSRPSVVYNSPGDYNVKLVVSNVAGTDSIVKTAYINVSEKFYCTNYMGGTTPGDISNVSITGTTLNETNHGCTYNNGSVYKRFPASGSSTVTLGKGKSYELSVTTTNSDNIAVWIDYDQDGSFESFEFTRITYSSTPNVPSKVYITIPNTAAIETTKMRIRTCSMSSYIGSNDACSYLSSGMTEDYTINITDVKDFKADDANTCINETVTFRNTSSVSSNSFAWDFGEGASPRTASTNGPHYIRYSTSGKKTISLTLDGTLIKKEDYLSVGVYPKSFNTSAPESYCSASSAFITIDGSEPTVNYGLFINNISSGESKRGTGSSMSWPLAGSGNYSIKARDAGNEQCSTSMGTLTIEKKSPGNYDRYVTICNGEEFTLPDSSKVKVAGEYTTTLVTKAGCDSIIKTRISIKSIPSAPVVSLNNSKLVSNVSTGNQWYSKENGLIAGATLSSYEPKKSGSYYNIVTQNGCKSLSSNTINYLRTGYEEIEGNNSISIFPNPITDVLNIKSETEITVNKIEIRNILGETIQIIKPENNTSKLFMVDMSKHAIGYYSLSIHTDDEVITFKFAKVN